MSNYAIYQPKNKASEYAKWACNFYVGCSNGCQYCYLKKGRGAAVLGGSTPELKKCFRDEKHALEVFEKELLANLEELRKHGLFFSFTTDPMLDQTIDLTMEAIMLCVHHNVPVKILTKVAFDIYWFRGHFEPVHNDFKSQIAIGVTLTGRDDLEPDASTNAERIEIISDAKRSGFKTFVSIEPVIDIDSSYSMILQSYQFCDLFKIGLESGKKYSKSELQRFIKLIPHRIFPVKIYFKDSLLKAAGISRENLPANCVTRDYNIFNN